jgi:hypothetical protein
LNLPVVRAVLHKLVGRLVILESAICASEISIRSILHRLSSVGVRWTSSGISARPHCMQQGIGQNCPNPPLESNPHQLTIVTVLLATDGQASVVSWQLCLDVFQKRLTRISNSCAGTLDKNPRAKFWWGMLHHDANRGGGQRAGECGGDHV